MDEDSQTSDFRGALEGREYGMVNPNPNPCGKINNPLTLTLTLMRFPLTLTLIRYPNPCLAFCVEGDDPPSWTTFTDELPPAAPATPPPPVVVRPFAVRLR